MTWSSRKANEHARKASIQVAKEAGESLLESEWRMEPVDVRNASILKRFVELVGALVVVGSDVGVPLNVHALASGQCSLPMASARHAGL